MKRNIVPALMIAVLLIPSLTEGTSRHGPLIKTFYAPWGFGGVDVPYRNPNGDIETRGSGTNEDTRPLKAARGGRISIGYFYDCFQAEAGYFRTDLRHQEIEEWQNGTKTLIPVKGELYYFDFRAGIRMNDPGDTSYSWLYLGAKRMVMDIDYNNTRAEGTGFLAGLYGFFSWGLNYSVEFVFNFDIYVGVYSFNKIRSDVEVTPERKIPFTVGGSLGAGFQYEPQNITLLVKLMPEFNHIEYRDKTAQRTNRITAGVSEVLFGFEIIYEIPNYRHNMD